MMDTINGKSINIINHKSKSEEYHNNNYINLKNSKKNKIILISNNECF